MTSRVLASVFLSVLAPAAVAAIAPPSGLAFNMQASADEAPAFRLAANGVQVYECRALLTTPDRYAWELVAPDATLSDPASGAEMATHRAMNAWNSLNDQSGVSAVLRATQRSGSGDLPWEYLRAIPSSEDGMFAGVTSVQRVDTRGGAAPDTGCSVDTAGTQTSVPFTAQFYFYKRRGAA